MWHDFYPDQKPVTKSDKPLELCTACDYTFLKEDQEYDHRHRAICPRCASLIEIPESVKLQRVWATLVAGTVSYTHLDVYKRQVLTGPVST